MSVVDSAEAAINHQAAEEEKKEMEVPVTNEAGTKPSEAETEVGSAAVPSDEKKTTPPPMILPPSLKKLTSSTNTTAATSQPVGNSNVKNYTFACG